MPPDPPTPAAPSGPDPAPPGSTGRAGALIAAWIERVRRFAPWVALAFLVLTAVSVLGPVRGLGIDTDTVDMLAEDLPWRQASIRYRKAFPHRVNELVVVIDGHTPDLAERARRRLAGRMRAEPALFPGIYLPGGGPFFRRHALLYRTDEELASLAENVERYGHWLRRLERDPSLGGFLATLEATLADLREGRETVDPAPLLGALAEAFRASPGWRFHELSWQELLWGRPATPAERRAFILVEPRLDYGSLLPAAAPVERIRSLAREIGLTPEHGVRVRLTGQVAMEHEELLTVVRGGGRAAGLALLMVVLVLYLGLRSAPLMAGAIATLLAGLAITAAFAALAVGHLNLISVAFAVLFIGLGIDYAIHFCLRYRELRMDGEPHAAALTGAGTDVGPSLALSAVTTAACFYAFVPTDFVGVSELGVIAGTGMFIGLVATLTLLPALLSIRPPRIAATGSPESSAAERRPNAAAAGPRRPDGPARGRGPLDRAAAAARRAGRALAAAPRRRPRLVLGIAAGVGLVSLPFLPAARFDHNPLNLRDPETESVATHLELLADTTAAPLTVAVLEPGPEEARETARRLAELEVVEGAVTLEDFVPAGQEEKRRRIAGLARVLGPRPQRVVRSERAGVAEVRSLLRALAAFRPFASPTAAGAARYLGLQARAWIERVESLPPFSRARAFEELERSLTGSLPGRLRALRGSLDPGRVEREDLPPDLVERWVSPAGIHRVEVRPREDVAETRILRRFVEAVQAVAPEATGAPVAELEAGDAVVRAFRKAFLYAAIATVGLLLLVLRSLRDALHVLLPLLLAGLLTVAVSAAVDLSFDFANVIALPLLLGVGVDNGIHMVHRARAAPPAHGDLLRTSTARAVVFASLTTVFSFGNLAFSGHPGMSGMGALLTVGMAAVLVCTLSVLPALLASASR